MTRYFLQGTPLTEFEKEMMSPTSLRRRGGGSLSGGIKGYGTLSYGCFAFRPYHELVRILMAEADILPLACRSRNVLTEQIELPYRDTLHEKRMCFLLNQWHSYEYPPSSAFAAAVYLLTADTLLWKKSEYVIVRYYIDFRTVDIRGTSIFDFSQSLYG